MSEADCNALLAATVEYAAPSPELPQELVLTNHILFDQGVVDAFGHVSVRHDKRSDRFLLARNMASGRVAAWVR